MKELSIKQKAERYDEISKEVKDFFAGKQKMYSDVEQTLNHLFPELAKSEDERIKEDLIQWIDEFPDTIWRGHYKKDILAWLEKQGEYKNIDSDDLATLEIWEDAIKENKEKWQLSDWFVEATSLLIQKVKRMENNENFNIKGSKIMLNACINVLREIGHSHLSDWLEKQGTSYTKKDVDDAYLKGVTDTKNEIEKQYEANYQTRKDIATFIFNYRGHIKDRAKWIDYLGIKVSFGEEQGEQKSKNESADTCDSLIIKSKEFPASEKRDFGYFSESAGKVEPKFKVGNWYQCIKDFFGKGVRFDKGNAYYCGQDGCLQEFDSGAHIAIVEELYKYFRLWTIQDAKDGDVLSIAWHEGNNSWEKIIIFKKYHNKGVKGLYNMSCVEGYGNTFKNGKLVLHEEVPYHSKTWTDNLQPATKEQRNTLEKAMRNAGWEFDFEKKELKKIEQNSYGGELGLVLQ